MVIVTNRLLDSNITEIYQFSQNHPIDLQVCVMGLIISIIAVLLLLTISLPIVIFPHLIIQKEKYVFIAILPESYTDRSQAYFSPFTVSVECKNDVICIVIIP